MSERKNYRIQPDIKCCCKCRHSYDDELEKDYCDLDDEYISPIGICDTFEAIKQFELKTNYIDENTTYYEAFHEAIQKG